MDLRRGSIPIVLVVVAVILGVVGYVLFTQSGPVTERGPAELINLDLPQGKAFAIFRIPGKELYHVEFDSQERQNTTLNAIQVFAEDAELHGHIFNAMELTAHGKDGTLAVGHNYSFSVLRTFLDESSAQKIRLSSETRRFLKQFERLGVFGKDGGVVTIAQDADKRTDVLIHEYTHGEYYVNPEYRKAVKRIWDRTSSRMQNIIREIFRQYNYNSDNDDLVFREFAAWFLDDAFVLSFPERERHIALDIQTQLKQVSFK